MKVRRILLAVDLEGHEDAVLEEAIAFARSLSAPLTILHVVRIPMSTAASADPVLFDAVGRWLRESAEQGLGEMCRKSAAAGVSAHPLILDGWPAEKILEAIRDLGADLVILGTHQRSAPLRFLIGSVATALVAAAPCPVLTVGRKVRTETVDVGEVAAAAGPQSRG